MGTGIHFTVSASDGHRLDAIISAPSSPQRHVWRARIVVLSADGAGAGAIMASTGKSKTCVWRWQARFMAEGVEGLLHEKTRPPGIPKTAAATVADVLRLTQGAAPQDATHWTLRAMAGAVGWRPRPHGRFGVHDIWKAHGLAPHRWRQFKRSNDPAFAENLRDVVGLYVAPPAHAVVLSVDEPSQIQAPPLLQRQSAPSPTIHENGAPEEGARADVVLETRLRQDHRWKHAFGRMTVGNTPSAG